MTSVNQTKAQRLSKLEAVLGLDDRWPLADVLERLADAVEHAQTAHQCDRLGHELDSQAVRRASELAAVARAAYATSDKRAKPQ
jgi:hypothetical protein